MRRSSGTVSLMRTSPLVTPASAMKEPISMWSGAISCVQPCSSSRPWTVRTLEPMPWMSAPILTSMRARSCTCGSQAELPITVAPGVSAAAISAFSVAMTEGSSMKTLPARSPPFAVRTMSPSRSCTAPRHSNASRCGSSRRRPITSPPGGGMTTRPNRASRGPASRNEARMSSLSARSMRASASTARAQRATSWDDRHSTLTPTLSSSSSIVVTSRIRGTLETTTSSSVSRQAARIGSAAFLLPAGVTLPDSGTPPSMTNFSMGGSALSNRPGRWARVTTMPREISREEAWDLLTEWVSSESLRRHCLCVEAGMRAYAERLGGDTELWGVTGLLHDADYERFPDMDDTEKGHPRSIMAELERRDAPSEMVRGIASHADFLDVSRDSEMEKALYACDELSGFLTACAYVRPEGIRGLTPKSVKKKLKQPSFAAAVNRDDVRHGAGELGVDFDEHVAFVVAALEARADELELHGADAAA